TFIDLFLNEAKLAALLAHPNVVQIFELGQVDGNWFIAMEYVNGHSLSTVLETVARQKKVLAAVCAARLCSQALQGLHYAHRLTNDRGEPLHLVHRDVSPENIMLTFDGGVKLVDFGIAKARASAERLSRAGKLPYMAPEQVASGAIEARTDIYSMGVVL